ncbi:MAG: BrnA antitoxin family protein [Bradyrhizobium sp.]
MRKKNVKSAAASPSERYRAWADPDDAPEITDEALDRATIVKGGKVIQRGRPPLGDLAKRSVTIRLDADVVDAYRSLGRGWQTRLNADLRRVRKLKKVG